MSDIADAANARVMVTLASLCYEHSSDIARNLARTDLDPKGAWELVWGPGLKGSNLAYIVENKVTGEYAIAIRGTIVSLDSILEDVESFLQEPLPWKPASKSRIARGMAHCWQHLTTARSPEAAPAAGQTIGEYLASIPSDATVYVTGHSQGGALSTVVACWIHDTHPGFQVIPMTFAGETAGNPAFADDFDARFLGKPGGRYYHDLDIVPKGYVFAELETIPTLYAPEPPGIKGSFVLEGMVESIIAALEGMDAVYEHCGNPVRLPDTLVPAKDVHFGNRQLRFAEQVAVQHSSFTYQALLGAPLTPDPPAQPWPPNSIPYAVADAGQDSDERRPRLVPEGWGSGVEAAAEGMSNLVRLGMKAAALPAMFMPQSLRQGFSRALKGGVEASGILPHAVVRGLEHFADEIAND
ncbi:MAG: hypothetical protein GY719_36370 [bacterium]|nr:hypothetical protein [bacterium]